jgi:hypothetical protein
MITRRQAQERYGSSRALAEILGVTQQTVLGYPIDDPLPPSHQKTLAGWIDRAHWQKTYDEIAHDFPLFEGDNDPRVNRRRKFA